MANPLDNIARWTPPEPNVPLPKRPAKGSGSAERKARNPAPEKAKPDRADRCPDQLRAFAMQRDGFACIQCGATPKPGEPDTKLEVDRIVPGAADGKYVEENVAVLCRKCNRSKGAKRLDIYKRLVQRHRSRLEGKPVKVWPEKDKETAAFVAPIKEMPKK